MYQMPGTKSTPFDPVQNSYFTTMSDSQKSFCHFLLEGMMNYVKM